MKSFSPLKWVQGTGGVTYVVACGVPFVTYLDISDIVAAYNALFPSMQLTYNPDCNQWATADLVFYVSALPCNEVARGCEKPLGYQLYGDAWWPTKFQIYINDAYPSNERRTAIAHEIGHLYGLGEGYIQDRRLRPDGLWEAWLQCNYAAPASVMDLANCDNLPQSPTALDQQRIIAYWTAQPPTAISSQDSDYLGNRIHTWKNNGYTTVQVWYEAQRWTGGSWSIYSLGNRFIYNQDEVNYKWEDWRTTFSTIPTSVPASGPHRLCLQALSYGIDGWSALVCTEYTNSGLLGFWTLEEGAGTVANDSSGLGNNGNLLPQPGGPTWLTPGRVGNWALSLDGADDYVDAGPASRYPTGSAPRSLTLWIRFQDKPTGSNGLFNYGSLAPCRLWQIDSISSWGFRFNAGWSCDRDFVVSLAPNTWSFVALVYDGGTLSGYVNGVLVTSYPLGLDTGTDLNLHLGKGESGSEHLSGALDQVRLYNRALSAAEVLDLFNNP